MRAKMLLLVPLGLALGGCATMDLGGLLGYPTTTAYPNYSYPTYTQPSYSYGYPTQRYYGTTPYAYGSQPAIVAPGGSYYGYGATANDYDGDRVSNSMDRYPYDPRRW